MVLAEVQRGFRIDIPAGAKWTPSLKPICLPTAIAPGNWVIYSGYPSLEVETDYQVMRLAARAYCRYFEEYNATLVFYILAKERGVVEEIDTRILSRSVLKQSHKH